MSSQKYQNNKPRKRKQTNNLEKNSNHKETSYLSKLVSVLVVLFITIPLWLYFFYQSRISKPLGEGDEVVVFKVEQGATRDQISNDLEKVGILSNPNILIWYMRISKKGGKIQAGEHGIPRNVNIKQLVEILETVPEKNTVWVTIPEGLRYDEISKIISLKFSRFQNRDIVLSEEKLNKIFMDPISSNIDQEAKIFLQKYLPKGKSLEGFLYPDTYNFEYDASAEEVTSMLVLTLKGKLADRLGQIDEMDYDLYEILTIASMLEREAFTKKEAGMIADIILRRLKKGMFLGIDATSLYELKNWKAELTYQVLETESPYNTRKTIGLPPTPISNPGIMTIDAVLNPTENKYLYYLHDLNGQIHYAETNSGHESNKSKYL